ncbi:class I SAM-dependent methyltransferase [Lysobacter niabensis]|uniref:class I SAM-dependent methyltransferase n=1 Tax=Agrilutibacter niabensis TaxID=380628 RepID=UPI00360608C4
MLARLYSFLDRWVIRALTLAEVIHCGFWMGVLRRPTLHQVTALFYARHALFVDADHNASGLYAWERGALDRYFPREGAILVPACGGGRELAALADAGYRTTGFDPEPRLVAEARARDWDSTRHPPRILHAAADTVPAEVGMHDAAVIGWGAYTHMVGRPARVAFLAALGQCLPPGAPVLLSFWTRGPRDRRLDMAFRLASVVAKLALNSRRPERGDWLGQNFAHYFNEQDIRDELAAAGFEFLEYAEAPYGHAVARRI